MVDGNVEESLNLARVEVHRQDAVRAGVLDHVRDHAGGDRLARGRLPVLAGIEEARNDRRDPLRGGETGGVDHHHQLDQVGVDRCDRGLHQKDIGAANGLGEAAVRIAVGEGLELHPAELRAQLRRDRLRELRMRAPGKEPQPLGHRQRHARPDYPRFRATSLQKRRRSTDGILTGH